jgi:hypothetical protein
MLQVSFGYIDRVTEHVIVVCQQERDHWLLSQTAEHVAGVGEDGPGAFGVVHLGQRDPGHRVFALVQELAEAVLHAHHVGDVRQHPGEPVLDELESGQRHAELLALLGVRQGRLVARDGGADRLPGDAETRGQQDLLGVAEGVHVRQVVLGRYLDVGEGDLRVLDTAQRRLALDDLDAEPGRALLDHVAAHMPFVAAGPDDHVVGEARIADTPLVGPVWSCDQGAGRGTHARRVAGTP